MSKKQSASPIRTGFFAWLRSIFPVSRQRHRQLIEDLAAANFESRKRLEKECAERIRQIRHRHEIELTKERELVQKLVQKMSKANIERMASDQSFSLRYCFSGRMVADSMYNLNELRMIADEAGRYVANSLMTSKFWEPSEDESDPIEHSSQQRKPTSFSDFL